jgi:hypothetical protein
MRTSAAALELDFTEPSITAAKAVADTSARNGSLQRSTLLWVMEQAYGASSADGRWSLRDAYDMLELAEVMYLAKADLPADYRACLHVTDAKWWIDHREMSDANLIAEAGAVGSTSGALKRSMILRQSA